MKRLSRTIMTTMLVALLAFSLVGCKSTAKVEPILPAPVVGSAPIAPGVEPAPIALIVGKPSLPYEIQEIVKSEGAKTFDLFIVHTNDLNGNIYAQNGGIGVAKLSTMANAGKAITDNWLMLNAGDVGAVPADKAMVVAGLVDLIGYDAYTPQVVQLVTGITGTKKALPLSANALDVNGYLVVQPYQVYNFNGFKVGVVGLTSPKPIQGVTFTSDPVLSNAQYAIDMAKGFVDYIVVLGDLGSTGALSSEVVCQNIDGIDLFVDGNGDAMAKTVNGTLIVRADSDLRSIGVVQLHVVNGKVVSTYPVIIPAADVLNPAESKLARSYGITSIPDDPQVSKYIGDITANLSDKMNIVIANVPEKLDGERENVSTKQTNLSKLITQAMTAESGADFTITNGGGISASIKAGAVTVGDVLTVLPFSHIITVCELKGSEVYAALEHGYSLLPATNSAFSQTDLQVVYNRFGAPGKRILRVLLNGKAIDKNATYKVATNDFMAAGGDGYSMFGRVLTEGSLLSDLFMDFLSKYYPAK